MTALDRRGAARVLLVMNEPLANLVSLTLQHLDIEVRAVRRVKDASELLKREAAHLIIGDVTWTRPANRLLRASRSREPTSTREWSSSSTPSAISSARKSS